MNVAGMTLSDQIGRFARTTPAGIAFRDGPLTLTWHQTDERIDRLASALAAAGLGAGDRAAVMALNSVPHVEAMAAILRVGAICVPVNFRMVAAEVAYVLSDSGATTVLVDDAFTSVVDAAATPDVHAVLTLGAGYEAQLAAAPPTADQPAVADEAPAFIMYTSGTTGRPKGAVLSHRNLVLHAYSNIVTNGVTGDDRVGLSGAPLFHIAGLSGFCINLAVGATTVLTPSGGFDPVAMVDLLERERVSSCFFVPAQWAAIVAVPGLADRDLSALRRCSWGAAPASTTLLRSMIDAFPQADIVSAFGQTECSPVTCLLRGEDAIRKIGSIGRPIVNVEARIVDDDLNDVAPGAVGEIVYRGPLVMSGYWNKPEETAEAFRGGWFHSGDLVRADEDGYLYVVDRKKDMIISGGENIYCAEVENVLAAHPKIAEVALIGVADARYGEAPLAVIAPRDAADPPTADDVEAFCRAHLAAYKRPRDVVIVSSLPRNPSGKVLKTRLRSEYGTTGVVTTPAV
ncbi:MAG TPA: long-chain-fatty-acid--CoA ligase [Pseudonocardia sp.]